MKVDLVVDAYGESAVNDSLIVVITAQTETEALLIRHFDYSSTVFSRDADGCLRGKLEMRKV